LNFTPEELFELSTGNGGRFHVNSPEDGFNFCKKLATSHYENFPVSSFLIPSKYRKYIYSIYSFARIADDIADELNTYDKEIRLEALDEMYRLISDENRDFSVTNPIFLSLYSTMTDCDLPALPFQKLLQAFKYDVNFIQPYEFWDLEYYCCLSANPVGELILRVFNLYNDKTAYLSDNICTGLQLVNFWQDLSRDINNNRIYMPRQLFEKYTDLNDNLQFDEFSVIFNSCIDELYDFTEKFFIVGKELIPYLKPLRLRMEINATLMGGIFILKKLRILGNDVLTIRPKLTKSDFIRIFIKSILFG
jgi:squalene synthase HpnC